MAHMASGGELCMGPVDDPDRYRLWRRIGTGGEGTVWQGTRQLTDGAIGVAVKEYHTERFGVAESLPALSARLETQAARLRQLHTPGLAVVHESFLGPRPHAPGDADGSREAAYFVMDYVDGEPLYEWAGTEGRMPRRLAVLEDVAAALDGLHRADQVHGDVKPSNLLVHTVELPDRSRVPIAVLVDFGVMRAVTGRPPSTLVGTEGFLAPELRRGQPYSPASDLYAFAMVCAALVCGGQPGHDIGEAARAARLPEEGVAVLLAGVDHDPGRRTRELGNGISGWLSRLRGGLTTTQGSWSGPPAHAPTAPPPGNPTAIVTPRPGPPTGPPGAAVWPVGVPVPVPAPPPAPVPDAARPPAAAAPGGRGCLRIVLLTLALMTILTVVGVVVAVNRLRDVLPDLPGVLRDSPMSIPMPGTGDSPFILADPLGGSARRQDYELADLKCRPFVSTEAGDFSVSGKITNKTAHKQRFMIFIDFVVRDDVNVKVDVTQVPTATELAAGETQVWANPHVLIIGQPRPITCRITGVDKA
jgi:hypothetical protein